MICNYKQWKLWTNLSFDLSIFHFKEYEKYWWKNENFIIVKVLWFSCIFKILCSKQSNCFFAMQATYGLAEGQFAIAIQKIHRIPIIKLTYRYSPNEQILKSWCDKNLHKKATRSFVMEILCLMQFSYI